MIIFENCKVWKIILPLIAGCMHWDASALGQLSRACRFDTIPTGLKNISVRFFYALGAPESVKTLPQLDSFHQSYYWINESLTTDYLRARYYLYAMSWTIGYVEPNIQTLEEYKSPWGAQLISQLMKADPYFAPYYVNRETLFSARAGDPEIVRYDMWKFQPVLDKLTLGAHFYYDPNSKQTTRLPNTSARDCNLSNWGIGTGLWGR